jgi:hypothetical protein
MRRLFKAVLDRVRRFFGWFRLGKAAIPISIAAFVVGSLGGGAIGHQGYLWAWIDPEFCYICHIHDYAVEDWRRSIHGEVVTCHDCHRVPLMHYTKTFFHTFVDRPSFPEDLEHLPHISSETCETCHITRADAFEELSSPMPLWVFDGTVKVEDSPAHVWHMEATTRDPGEVHGGDGEAPRREHRLPEHGAKAHELGLGTGIIECIDCHGSEANRFHNFLARAENCIECHQNLSLRGEHLSDFDCKHCHYQDFLAPADVHARETESIELQGMEPSF